jgi:hypothetical protein
MIPSEHSAVDHLRKVGKSNAGTSCPAASHVGFLLRHHAAAVRLMERAKTVAPSTTSDVSEAPATRLKMTVQEFDALMAEFSRSE